MAQVGFGIAAIVAQVGAAIYSAQAQAAANRSAARAADEQARRAREAADKEAEALARDRARKMGLARASLAAAGVKLSGSSGDVLADLKIQYALDVENVRQGGINRALDIESQAALLRKQAKYGAIGGFINAGAAGGQSYLQTFPPG